MSYQLTVLQGIASACCFGATATVTLVNTARNYPDTQEVLKSIAIPAAFAALSAAYSISNYEQLNASDRIGIPLFGLMTVPLTLTVHMLLRNSDQSGCFTDSDSDEDDIWMANDPVAQAIMQMLDAEEQARKAEEDEDLKTLD